MLVAKHFFHQKMKSVGFIALSGCPEKTVFHIVLHLLSNDIGFIALPGNRIKPTLVGFIALSGFSSFLDFPEFSAFKNFLDDFLCVGRRFDLQTIEAGFKCRIIVATREDGIPNEKDGAFGRMNHPYKPFRGAPFVYALLGNID